MQTHTMSEMFHRLFSAEGESPAAKTVEYFGWLMLIESATLLFAPHFVAQVLHLPALAPGPLERRADGIDGRALLWFGLQRGGPHGAANLPRRVCQAGSERPHVGTRLRPSYSEV